MNGGFPFEAEESPEGEFVISFKSPLDFENAAAIWESLRKFLGAKNPSSIVVDLGAVPRVDSAGIALLQSVLRYCDRKKIPCRWRSVSPSTEYFLQYIETKAPPELPVDRSVTAPFLERTGEFFLEQAVEIRDFISFFNNFLVKAADCIVHPRRFRWYEMLYYLELSGTNAMIIIVMVSFLLGFVMAYQAAIQLRQFGANIYVADLVSLALARELAPIFTAMMLAGRSGSAFSAEIGTMKVGEELDALTVMGFDLTEFVTVPKVFALMISGPLLTMLSNFAGILGGILVSSVSLDLTPYSFMYEVYQVLSVTDILTGLIKAEFFAVLVALIGCFRGFQTARGADSVGRQTTSAVVSGIFLIILADAIFTLLFNAIGW